MYKRTGTEYIEILSINFSKRLRPFYTNDTYANRRFKTLILNYSRKIKIFLPSTNNQSVSS